MAQYIEKQAAIDELCYVDEYNSRSIATIRAMKPVDVRPVVTCAECDWHVDCGYHFCNKWCQPCPDNADFYCAYGERSTAVPT